MRTLSALLLALSLAASTWGQSVKLPAEVKGEPGAFVRVAAETDCTALQWYALDPGLNLFPVDLLKDTRTAVVTAGKAGRYRLLSYGAKGDKASAPAVCVVVVGEPPPPEPGPGPGPGPAPGPADPLTKSLQAAYDTEKDAEALKGLAAVYQAGADLLDRATTWGQLWTAMSQTAETMKVKGKLPKTQAAIAAYIKPLLPVKTTDPVIVTQGKPVLQAVAKALGEVKP